MVVVSGAHHLLRIQECFVLNSEDQSLGFLAIIFNHSYKGMGTTLNISISSGMGIRCRSRKNKAQVRQKNSGQVSTFNKLIGMELAW